MINVNVPTSLEMGSLPPMFAPQQQQPMQTLQVPETPGFHHKISHDSGDSQKPANQKGRKMTPHEQYVKESLEKIERLKKEAKQPGLSAKEKQQIRNKISAQESRLKKK